MDLMKKRCEMDLKGTKCFMLDNEHLDANKIHLIN
jgi:hypothetical protein